MSEEILVKQGAPTLAGIKTGSLFPCPCRDESALLDDIRRLNRLLAPKGLCLLPIRFKDEQALLYLYRPAVLHRDLQGRHERRPRALRHRPRQYRKGSQGQCLCTCGEDQLERHVLPPRHRPPRDRERRGRQNLMRLDALM